MESEVLQYFTTLGVGGSLAGLMFFFYRRDAQAHAERLTTHAEQWRLEAEQRRAEGNAWIEVIRGNTAAITLNTEVVRAVAQRLDR